MKKIVVNPARLKKGIGVVLERNEDGCKKPIQRIKASECGKFKSLLSVFNPCN